MPELEFEVISVSPARDISGVIFQLGISQKEPQSRIHRVDPRCQLRIEPARRRYSAIEQQRLDDLFGSPDRWGQTVRSMRWTNTTIEVPAFTQSTRIEMAVPRASEADDGISKYLDALDDGDVPLTFLFSGTIFYSQSVDSPVQISMISHETSASFRMPISIWHQSMQNGAAQ